MSARAKLRSLALGIAIAAGSISTVYAEGPAASDYDIENGHAYAELIIPAVVPAIYQSISPTAGDATLVLRATAILTNAWFDAIAPYHPTAVGVYSNLGRRPMEEGATNENMNIATLYASYHVLNSLLPLHHDDWRAMLQAAGLDPDDTQENTVSPVGIGNLAGKAVVKARENDGMNQLGNEGGREFNPTPYADYLGYTPVNTAHQLRNPSRWQPDIKRVGVGLYRVQEFVTPQIRVTEPYSYESPRRFRAPAPKDSYIRNFSAYKAQADEVLQASANLTDEQKMIAELFDDKLSSLGQSGLFMTQQLGMGLAESIHYEFLTNVAEFDTAIAVWDNKYRYDAVRPFSAIRYLYGNREVTAWGGPGKGTVYDIPATQWQSYLGVADHPEYPSGSASFCGAHAEASRLFFGSDELNWSVAIDKGTSRMEPGFTPASNIVLEFPTWTDFETKCGLSRLWGGVHFYPSIPAGRDIGHDVAKQTHKFMKKLLAGHNYRK